MSHYYSTFSTSFCDIVFVMGSKGLLKVFLYAKGQERLIMPEWIRDDKGLQDIRQQFAQYFTGKRQYFDIPLDMRGTTFQKCVWKALLKIPFGEVRSYKQIAEKIGSNKAYRAVGSANGKNPLPIVIPCHRVITASGRLGGFSCGIGIKKELLKLEQHHTIKKPE